MGISYSVPSYGYQRRDLYYQPTHRGHGRPPYHPRAARRRATATAYFQNPSAGLVWTRRSNNSCRSPRHVPGRANSSQSRAVACAASSFSVSEPVRFRPSTRDPCALRGLPELLTTIDRSDRAAETPRTTTQSQSQSSFGYLGATAARDLALAPKGQCPPVRPVFTQPLSQPSHCPSLCS